jgi:hypothetical protein
MLMHERTADFQHPLLALVLVLGNIPTYVLLGRLFFKTWQDFFDGVRSIGTVHYRFYMNRHGLRLPPSDREVNGLYAVLRLLLFVLTALACVGAEYRAIAWWMAWRA